MQLAQVRERNARPALHDDARWRELSSRLAALRAQLSKLKEREATLESAMLAFRRPITEKDPRIAALVEGTPPADPLAAPPEQQRLDALRREIREHELAADELGKRVDAERSEAASRAVKDPLWSAPIDAAKRAVVHSGLAFVAAIERQFAVRRALSTAGFGDDSANLCPLPRGFSTPVLSDYANGRSAALAWLGTLQTCGLIGPEDLADIKAASGER